MQINIKKKHIFIAVGIILLVIIIYLLLQNYKNKQISQGKDVSAIDNKLNDIETIAIIAGSILPLLRKGESANINSNGKTYTITK